MNGIAVHDELTLRVNERPIGIFSRRGDQHGQHVTSSACAARGQSACGKAFSEPGQ